MSNELFNEAMKNLFPLLEKYVPIVERVHGKHHPEFFEVRKVFNSIIEKVKVDSENPKLKEEFTKLREITGNYNVPGDVCETYEAVYNMLAEVDKAYQH